MTDLLPHTTEPIVNAEAVSPWSGLTLPQVFALAAASHPARVAIDDGAVPVTYGELRDRADRVASTLAGRVAGTGQHVALLAGPGADAVAAMLGTMSAGHAYVPLDPDDPPGRLRTLLDDSAACVLLVDRENLARAESLAEGRLPVLLLDDLDAPGLHPLPAPDPDAVAFLTYTSGSTGRPKGVLHQHRARLHACWHYSRFHALNPGDRVALLFSLSFGASSLVVYGCILNGATVCLPHLNRRGVAALAEWLDAEGITMAHSVPTTWRALLSQPVPPGGLRTLRTFDLGGEAVFAHDVAAWRARFGSHTRLTVRLASTEVSLITQSEIGNVDGVSGPIPVGPAAPGVRLTILRDDGSVAKAGEPGEIVIHTPHTSPGYWRQPDLTASRFSEDPARPGWRIYRGGDRGVVDEHGQLTILGRADAVIRIRGYSVHLAEVEAALRRIGGVDDAAVVVVGVGDPLRPGGRLVAFYTSEDARLEGATVRRALGADLPRYAIPGEAHRLDALPMTVTGKVDRSALATKERPKGESSAAAVSAPDDQEQVVAACVAGILHLPHVGRDEDFFDLGGDSMSLAALQVELERLAGRPISPQDLFDTPTVAGFAALVRRPANTAPPGPAVLWPVRSSGARTPLFMVHGGTGRVAGSRGFLDALGPEQPVWGFRAPTAAEHQPPLRSIAGMASLYIDAMRRVQPDGPYYIGGVCAGAAVAIEMACQLRDSGTDVAPLLLIDPPPFPRDRGRARYLLMRALVGLADLLASAPGTDALLAMFPFLGPASARADGPGRFGVWTRFRVAAYRQVPRAFAGATHVLASRQWAAPAAQSLRKYLTGDMEVRTAGRSHRDVFDSSNREVATALRACAEQAHAWLARARTGRSS